MSARFRPRSAASGRAISVWLIALLVALVATIQIRSQAEVERSFSGTDTASLAFLIDNLHRANDSLQAETADLTQQQARLQSGGDNAADQVLTDEALRRTLRLKGVARAGQFSWEQSVRRIRDIYGEANGAR